MKTFLKPTRAKIILALLIPLYFSIEIGVEKTLLADSDLGITYGLILLPLQYIVVLFMIAGLWIAPTSGSSFEWPLFSIGQKFASFFFELVLPLIVAYVVSCAIVCMFRKFKKSRKSEKSSHQAAI